MSKDRARALAPVRGLGVPLVDIHPAFAAQNDPLDLFPFRKPGHYNEVGNRVVVEEVRTYTMFFEVVDQSDLFRMVSPGGILQ